MIGLANSSEVISISWNPPPFEHQNGMIHSYKLNVTEVETGIVTMHTTFTTATTLFSLHPYYTYEIRVSAVTVATGPYSQSISIRTNPDGKFCYHKSSCYSYNRFSVYMQFLALLFKTQ